MQRIYAHQICPGDLIVLDHNVYVLVISVASARRLTDARTSQIKYFHNRVIERTFYDWVAVNVVRFYEAR